jgi:hypothetical protein
MSMTINFNNTAYFGQSIKSKLAGKKCTVLSMFNDGLIDLFGLVDVNAIKKLAENAWSGAQLKPADPVAPNIPSQELQTQKAVSAASSAASSSDVMKAQLWTYIHYLWKNNKDALVFNTTGNTKKYSPWFPKMSGVDGVASAQHFVEVVNQVVSTPGNADPLRIPTIDQLVEFINYHINTYNVAIPFAGMIYKRTLERLQKETDMAEDEFKIIQDHIDKINMYSPNTHRKIVEGKLGVIVSTDGERFEEVTPTKVLGLQQVRNLDPATGVSVAYREQRGRNTNPVK